MPEQSLIGKSNTNFVLAIPPELTGRTITITPSTHEVLNSITGLSEDIPTSTVSGDNDEFYSGNYDNGVSVVVLTVNFKTSSGYHFNGTPYVRVENEESTGGSWDATTTVLNRNSIGDITEAEVALAYKAPEEVYLQRGYPTIHFEGDFEADTVATQLITNYITPTKISNIQQNVQLVLQGDEGSEFRVTCTGSDGTSNIVSNDIRTIEVGIGFLSEEETFSSMSGAHVVTLSIPAKAVDVTWTVTVFPQAGTSLKAGLVPLTILQEGLKTLTFTDDTSGLTNTTFPDNITTFSANQGLSKRWVQRQNRDINSIITQNTDDITIVITASSGVVTLKPRSLRPTAAASFTNTKQNGIIISNIQTVQTSTTVVTLTFTLKVTVIPANVSSAIKLSDFLTN